MVLVLAEFQAANEPGKADSSNTHGALIESYVSFTFHSLSLSLLLGSLNYCIGRFHTSKKLSTCQSLVEPTWEKLNDKKKILSLYYLWNLVALTINIS